MISFHTRVEMLDWLPKQIRCIEVGVRKGAFAAQIQRRVEPRILWLVDCWCHIEDDDYEKDPSNVSTDDHLKNYTQVREAFRGQYNVAIFRAYSKDFSEIIYDETMDFVYLDAGHTRKQIESDLKAWYPKVRSGGILAGHDYLDPTPERPWIEVKGAVDKFLADKGLELEFVTGEEFPSWGVRKP